jgi:hypothetical protein
MQLHAFWVIQLETDAPCFSTRVYARKGMAVVLDVNILLLDSFILRKDTLQLIRYISKWHYKRCLPGAESLMICMTAGIH